MKTPTVGMKVLFRGGEDPNEVLQECLVTFVHSSGWVNLVTLHAQGDSRMKNNVPYSTGAAKPYSWEFTE